VSSAVSACSAVKQRLAASWSRSCQCRVGS
jgi:hypothetical protein